MSINKFFVAGYVGADPECHTIQNGDKKGEIIATFSLAENLGPDKDGNDRVAWHHVTASGRNTDIVSNHVRKGMKLVVEGRATAHAYVSKMDQKLIPQIRIWMSNFEFASDKPDFRDDSVSDESFGYSSTETVTFDENNLPA